MLEKPHSLGSYCAGELGAICPEMTSEQRCSSHAPSLLRREAGFRALLIGLEASLVLGRTCVVEGMPFSRLGELETVVSIADECGAHVQTFLVEVDSATAARRVATESTAGRGRPDALDRTPELVQSVASRMRGFDESVIPISCSPDWANWADRSSEGHRSWDVRFHFWITVALRTSAMIPIPPVSIVSTPPADAGKPTARAARTRMKIPCETTAIVSASSRIVVRKVSARAPTSSIVSPPGHGSHQTLHPGLLRWISPLVSPSK